MPDCLLLQLWAELRGEMRWRVEDTELQGSSAEQGAELPLRRSRQMELVWAMVGAASMTAGACDAGR